jgi:hypothetical protein
MMGSMTRRLCVIAMCLVFAAQAEARPRPKPVKVQNSIRGATMMAVAPWGLTAQGHGMLRILPLGAKAWQVVHQVRGDSLYRHAHDDRGRLLAWWEKESAFHLFDPASKTDVTFALPPAPGPEFKYGFRVEELFFAPDGDGAIVYMHGFVGGRTWEVAAYHYDLAGGAPTLLFRQEGYPLHTTARESVRAVPQRKDDMCEHTACHVGAIIAWEITGRQATKRVIFDASQRQESFGRVQPVWDRGGGDRVAVLLDEHPAKRRLLRWTRGDAQATTTLLPDGLGPASDAEAMWLTDRGDVIEVWLTATRGLAIRRIPPTGAPTVTTLAPHPKRTPRDHPLFGVSDVNERANGDLLIHWGEYLVLVPTSGAPRHLDLRAVFNRKTEFTGRLLHVRSPEGTWVGLDRNGSLDFAFLRQADLDARMTPAP